MCYELYICDINKRNKKIEKCNKFIQMNEKNKRKRSTVVTSSPTIRNNQMDINDVIAQLNELKIVNDSLKNELNSMKTDMNEIKQKNTKKKTGPKGIGGSAYNQFVSKTMKIYTENNYFQQNNIKGTDKMKFCAKLWNEEKKKLNME